MAGSRLNYMPPDVDPLSQPDIRMRHLVGGNKRSIDYSDRYSLLTDNSRLRERIEGSAITAPGSEYNNRFRNSGMAPTSFGGSSTSDDPGGYNWDTLNRNLARVPTAIGIGREFRKMMKTTTPEPPPPLITPANAQTFAPAMTYAQAQSVSAAINTASEDNPYAPGLSLDDARKTLDNLKTQYFGVGPVRKQSRNPAVQQPKKKSTAPKINPPKPAGA